MIHGRPTFCSFLFWTSSLVFVAAPANAQREAHVGGNVADASNSDNSIAEIIITTHSVGLSITAATGNALIRRDINADSVRY